MESLFLHRRFGGPVNLPRVIKCIIFLCGNCVFTWRRKRIAFWKFWVLFLLSNDAKNSDNLGMSRAILLRTYINWPYHVVGGWSSAALYEMRFQSHAILCGIYGWKLGTRKRFPPPTSVFSHQYYTIHAPYSFIHSFIYHWRCKILNIHSTVKQFTQQQFQILVAINSCLNTGHISSHISRNMLFIVCLLCCCFSIVENTTVMCDHVVGKR